MMDALPKCGDSMTWKDITKSLSFLKGGFRWHVTSSTRVSLWFDAWLLHEPLCFMVEEIDPGELLWTVADLLHQNGT